MIGRGRRKFKILVVLESLILHSLVLFQYQTQQHKQNITNSHYLYGYFLVTRHLKTTFPYFNNQKKMPKKIWGSTRIPIFTGKMLSITGKGYLRNTTKWRNSEAYIGHC